MNIGMLIYIIGWALNLVGGFMIIPIVTALFYQEPIYPFLLTAGICLVLGIPMTLRKIKTYQLHAKDGCIAVSLSWVVISVFGMLPFLIGGSIPNVIDALFETVSGFTTTGASILNDVECLPYSILMWRSFTHWIGGMGLLVFFLALIRLPGGSHMNLMKAESPGPSVSKLVPKIQSTAVILYAIYFGLTLLEIAVLLICDMPLFDAIATTFGTAGTGGFGIKNDSIGGYSSSIQWVVTVFMIAFGVNFNAYFLLLIKKWKQAFASEEVRWYFAIIFAAVAIIVYNTYGMYSSLSEALRHTFFQVGSVITTTGYSTVNFDLWPEASKTVLLILMFVGACAGSTGGGIKVSRIMILIKSMGKEIKQYYHPRLVGKIRLEGQIVEHEVVRNTNTYIVLYLLIFIASLLAISFDGKDFITNFSGVAATLNNIGPGLNLVGPTCNFSVFSPLSKLVLIFDMLAGRLELFPMLLLFTKETWRKY